MAERTLNDICIIAKQAGLILREGYEKSHDIKQKTRQDDLVTEMDKKSEDFILAPIPPANSIAVTIQSTSPQKHIILQFHNTTKHSFCQFTFL